MPEPITFSVAAVAVAEFLGHSIGSHLIGGEVHHFYREFLESWRESPRDPATGMPRNHDLQMASENALREATLVLILELAGRFEPEKPWLSRLVEKIPGGGFLNVELFPGTKEPRRGWLENLRRAVFRKDFNYLHNSLRLSDDDIRDCFAGGDLCAALGPRLAVGLLEWARFRLPSHQEPPEFESLLRDGWQAGGCRPITLVQVYCLFFREHLKREPKVFRILITDTLNEMRSKFDTLGVYVTNELKAFRDKLNSLDFANLKLDFTDVERWLEPQLSEIRNLIGDAKSQLDTVAHAQHELANRQGEILVAITTLRSEVARNGSGASVANAQLSQLASLIIRFERKLDYAIAGLPIQRFQLPEPPTHELELLHAKHRAVDLVGRETDLGSLWQWLTTGQNISARLVVGRAGTGKTRIAYELLLRVNAKLPDWQAGLLTGSALRKFDATKQPADWTWPAPTLLVVDYAQTLANPLAELLRALTHKRRVEGLPPLRLLLLERQPEDWFDTLLRQEDSGGPCAVGKLFDPPAAVPLTSLPEGELRRRVLSQVLDKAAKLNDKPTRPGPPEGNPDYDVSLKRDLFAEPLNLMLAALAASELGLLPALTRSRTQLAEDLAKKELRRLGRFARIPGNAAQERVLHHLAACATMERGFTSEELKLAVKEELTALAINWPDGAGDLAAVLQTALPSKSLAVAPIEPDFVGEALVLEALARRVGQDAACRRDWTRVVERCCRRDPRATPATLLHAFQNFGQRPEFGEPLLAATDALISAGIADQQPALLLGIENAMPHQTVELRIRAAEVTRHLYTRLKALLENGRDELKPEVARLASSLAIRLGQSGRPAEALPLAQEAVESYRALARQNPDAFNPGLATSLNNLATRLGELGRPAEALPLAQEAVEYRRALARQNPDAFNQGLSVSLNNLAIWLSRLGRPAEALPLARETVEMDRALARQNPEAFPDLANSLNNLANRLSELGRPSEGVPLVQEAVELYRTLARQNPDAFDPGLARSLNNLAIWLSELGRPAEALPLAEESVELYHALARQNPDAFNPGLASSLNNLANLLGDLGRRAKALPLAQEAVESYRALAWQNPDAFNPDLAMALNNLATRLSELGRPAEALPLAQEAVEYRRALARQNPDAFNPDLASSLNNIANLLGDLGRRAEAMLLAQEAVESYRALVQQNPDAFNPGLATSLNTLAIELSELGRPAEALPLAQEAVELYHALARQNPESFNPDLTRWLSTLGMVLVRIERHAEAVPVLAEAVRVLQPQFVQLPEAYERPMLRAVEFYLRAAQAASVAPDLELLIPIQEKLQGLKGRDQGAC